MNSASSYKPVWVQSNDQTYLGLWKIFDLKLKAIVIPQAEDRVPHQAKLEPGAIVWHI
jgi:hypothetical protein